MLGRCVSLRDLFMGLSKHLGVGIFVLMKRSKSLISSCEENPCVYKKFSGSKVALLVLYVDDILLIGNDIPMLESVKGWLKKCFSLKDLGEAGYILEIKIYKDRSKRLLVLCQDLIWIRFLISSICKIQVSNLDML